MEPELVTHILEQSPCESRVGVTRRPGRYILGGALVVGGIVGVVALASGGGDNGGGGNRHKAKEEPKQKKNLSKKKYPMRIRGRQAPEGEAIGADDLGLAGRQRRYQTGNLRLIPNAVSGFRLTAAEAPSQMEPEPKRWPGSVPRQCMETSRAEVNSAFRPRKIPGPD